jgi:hypothetical protein
VVSVAAADDGQVFAAGVGGLVGRDRATRLGVEILPHGNAFPLTGNSYSYRSCKSLVIYFASVRFPNDFDIVRCGTLIAFQRMWEVLPRSSYLRCLTSGSLFFVDAVFVRRPSRGSNRNRHGAKPFNQRKAAPIAVRDANERSHSAAPPDRQCIRVLDKSQEGKA